MSAGHAPFARASDAHDSAGIPFGGREITSTGFDDDTGASDPQLVAALVAGDESTWMALLAQARLIVPIVAAPAEVDTSGELAVEKETDMAVVTLRAPDGVSALPVFTGVAALAAWNPQARPSPVTADRAAQAALSEGCEVMLLDLGSAHQVVLRAPMVMALAQQEDWTPLDRDPLIRAALGRATAGMPAVRDASAEDAGEGVLRVRLLLEPGLNQADLENLATRIGEILASDGEARSRIDGLEFALQQA